MRRDTRRTAAKEHLSPPPTAFGPGSSYIGVPASSASPGPDMPVPASFRLVLPLLALLILTLGVSLPSYGAGGDILWQYGDAKTGKQEAEAMAIDSQGSVILAGFRVISGGDNEYYVAKLRSDGTGTVWTASYNKASGDDEAVAIAVDSNNDVIVTGYEWNGGHYDIHTIKYSGGTGAVLWQSTFDGSAHGNDLATAIAVDGLNNIYVAGYSQNTSGNEDYLVLKYGPSGPNPDGTPVRQAIFNGAANGADKAISLTAGVDGIAVTGSSWNGADFDFLTIKYDLNLSPLWEKRYSSSGTQNDAGSFVKMDAAGNVVVAGSASNGSNLDIYTVKYNGSNSTIIKEWTHNGGYDDEPRGLWVDASGNIFITGYTWTLAGRYEFYTASYDASTGGVIWEQTYGSGGNNDDVAVATGIVVDQSDNVFVTGFTYKAVEGNYDFQTLKYRKENGSALWQQSFDGAARKDDMPVGIVLTPSGEIIVAGWSDAWTAGASDYDFYAIKYDPGLLNAPTRLAAETVSNTEIQLSWSDNAANEDGFRIERKIGLDGTYAEITTTPSPLPANTVSYTDTGLSTDTKYYYRIMAFNAANGNSHYSNEASAFTRIVPYSPPSWSYTYNGADSSDDITFAIAAGPDNNPVVTGMSFSDLGSFDYYTIKLDRNSGSRIWDARYNGDQDDLDAAVSVSVDGNNDAIVSGYSTLYSPGAGTNTNDIYTLKYAAATGLPELWHDVYDGPTHNDDRSTAVATAVDGSNNVVVVGYGKNGVLPLIGTDDLYVIKYLPNGSRDWAATPYDGPGQGNDYPTAAVFDQAGNIFVSGYVSNSNNNYDFFTAKYCGSATAPCGGKNKGEIIWSKIYNGAGNGNDHAKALTVDPSGNVYVTGSVLTAPGNEDFYTVKYNGATGDEMWTGGRSFDGAAHGNDGAVSIEIDPLDGDIVVAGTSLTETGNNDFVVIKYHPNGDEAWTKPKTLYRPANDDYVVGMGMDLSGNVCVAGTTNSGATTDMMSIKLDYEGNTIGATLYNGTADNYDYATAVAVNSLGEAFIAGYTRNSSGNDDYVVFKCAWDSLQVAAPFAAVPGYTDVTLTWSDNSTTELGYTLERKTGSCSTADTANTCEVGDAGCPWTWRHDVPLGTVPYTSYLDTAVNTGSAYCYRIHAYGSGGTSSRYIGTPATTASPIAPSGLTATAVNTSRIHLAWTDNTTNEEGFKIDRCAGSGCVDFAEIATAPGSSATYDDIGLDPSTIYRYRVRAFSASSWTTGFSNTAEATTTIGPPTGLLATVVSTTRIDLAWTDASVDETGFKIERCETPGCGNFAQITLTGPNATTYSDTTVCSATAYTYRVRAANDGLSNGSGGCWTGRKPLTITNFRSDSQMKISVAYDPDMQPDFDDIRFYDETARVELPYWIEKKTDGVSATIWIKTGATSTIKMYYGNPNAASASNAANLGFVLIDQYPFAGWSDTRSSTCGSTRMMGGYSYFGSAASTQKTLSSLAAGNYAVTFNYYHLDSWDGESGRFFWNGAQQWSRAHVAGGTNVCGGSWGDSAGLGYDATTVLLSHPGGDATLKFDSTLDQAATDESWGVDNIIIRKYTIPEPSASAGTEEQSACFAFGGTWNSIYTNESSATTQSAAAPVLTAARISEVRIDLSWTDGNADETGFKIWRCDGAGCNPDTNAAPLASTAAGMTTYQDTDLMPSTVYRYLVKAHKTASCNWEASSGIAEATTTIAAPGSLTANALDTTRIDLSWADNTASETGFRVERCTVGVDCPAFAPIVTTGPNAVSYSDTSACDSKTYDYRVMAVNEGLSNSGGGTWTRHAPLTITNFQPSFQTKVVISYDADMQPDFDDIRFYDETALQEIPYWIETKTDGNSATVWFRTGKNNNISLYYGNAGATASGNGEAVFEFFDDFQGAVINAAKWTEIDPNGSISQNNDLVLSNVSSGWTKALISKQTFTRSADMRLSVKLSTVASTGSDYLMMGWELNQNTNASYTQLVHGLYFANYGFATYEKGGNYGSNVSGYTASTDYEIRFDLKATGAVYSIKGGSYANWTVVRDLSNYADSPMRLAFTQNTHPMKIHTVRVQRYASTEPSVALNAEVQEPSGHVFSTWNSGYSNEASAATAAPAAPDGLTATPLSESQLSLSWTDRTTDETGFAIERKAEACSSNGLLFIPIVPLTESFVAGINPELWSQRGVLRDAGTGVSQTVTVPPVDATDGNGTVRITPSSGAVELFTASTGGGTANNYNTSRLTLNTPGVIQGDFDAMIDFALPEGEITASQYHVYARLLIYFPNTANGQNYAYVERNVGSSGNTYYGAVMVDGTSTGSGIATSDTSGKLRIARTGSILSVYIRTAGAWSRLAEVAGASTAASNNLLIIQYVQRNEAAALKATVDNFALAVSNANAASLIDTGLNSGATYCYRVKAYKTAACGWETAYTGAAEATTLTPPAPTGLSAAPANTTQIDLSWTDNTGSETGFVIQRCTGAGCSDFADLATAGPNVTTYSDASACASTTYQYRVRASKTTAPTFETGYSNTATATPPGLGGSPTLTAVRAAENQIDLSWSDGNSDESGSRIDRCADADCNTVLQTFTVGQNITSFNDAWLANSTTYYYRVHAYKTATCGWNAANSTIMSATTTVTAPSGLTASFANTTRINLSWTDTTVSETAFVIQRCTGAGCSDFADLSAVGANVTSHQDTTVCSATSYSYRAKARGEGLSNSGGGCWTRRVPLTITDFQPNFLTRMVIPYAAAMQPDFDDLRFYDVMHVRELPYWIESKSDGVSATVWIKTGDNNAVYLYYGNTNAASADSISGVFGSGLMGFWQFNEPSGTVSGATADGSGQGNAGTLYNFAAPYGIVGSGRFGNALSLNGSNNYVRRDATNLPTGSVATVEAWVYPKAYGDVTYNGIVSWGSRSCNGRAMLLSMQNSGMPSMATWCNDFTPSSGAAATLNAWNHIAVVLNGKSVTLYMNGQPVSGTLTYTPSIQQSSLAIGSTDFPGRYFNGMLDEVRIYNRALSASEIASRYAAADPSASLGSEEQSACFTFANAFDSQYSATASAATPAPAVPVLTATRSSEVQIDLSWTDGNPDETGFKILRCSGSGCTPAEPPLATVGANVTSYSDSDLAPETLYRYQIKVYKTADCGWEQASNVSETTSTIAAPGGFSATAVNTTRIDLSWTDNSGSETGFDVERCAGSSCSDFAAIATVNANTTTYSDNSACNSTTYNYRVRAADEGLSGGGGSCWTRRAPLTISNFLPDHQVKVSVAYDPDMQPDFDDIRFYDGTAGNELPYWIESKTDGVSATVWVKTGSNNTLYLYYGNTGASSASSGPNTFEFFDDFRGATIDTAKWSEIDPDSSISQNNDLVLNDVSESWTKALISKQTFSRTSDKKIYLKLSIPADTAGNNHFMAGWEANQTTDPGYAQLVHGFYWNNYLLSTYEKGSHTGPNTQSYAASTDYEMKIELKSAGAKYFIKGGAYANWTQVQDTTAYTDAALRLAITQYSHQANIHLVAVQKYASVEPSVGFGAEESSGCYTYAGTWDGPYSTESAATTSAPAAPGGLTAAAVTDTVESLTWTDTTGDETGFTIERCTGTGCGDFSPIGSTAAGVNTYADASREPSTIYCYRVKTYKSASCAWETGYSNTACDMTFSATPTGLTATAINSMKIGLAWADNSSDEDGFEVEVMAWNGRWTKTATVGPNIHAYIDTIGIDPNTPYVYRVRAFRGADQSPYSNEALVTYTKDGTTINTTPAYTPGDNTCQYALTLITAGPGTTTSSPEGVSCGTGCAAYCQGAIVILRAMPEDGKTFNGWGGACAGTAACTLTMDGDKQVTAGFQ